MNSEQTYATTFRAPETALLTRSTKRRTSAAKIKKKTDLV